MNIEAQAELLRGAFARWLQLSFTLATFVTGVVDAVSYLGLGHVFSANMTGNVVLLGFAAAHSPNLSVTRSAIALFAALIGGVYAGRLEKALRPIGRRRWIVTAATSECVLLCVAAGAAFFCQTSGHLAAGEELGLIALTALAMGIRNGTVRHMGAADITTTVLTLTIAGLSSESTLAGGKNPHWGRRITAILVMLAGAYVGACLVRVSLSLALGAAAGILACAIAIHTVCETPLSDIGSPE
jgi:uncharacterized membrane protein YoaK (UPF0700 family)